MEFFQNNAIVGVPMPGPYYIYNYFSHTHPLFYKINYLRIDKITFRMILLNISWNLFETTKILHLHGNRH